MSRTDQSFKDKPFAQAMAREVVALADEADGLGLIDRGAVLLEARDVGTLEELVEIRDGLADTIRRHHRRRQNDTDFAAGLAYWAGWAVVLAVAMALDAHAVLDRATLVPVTILGLVAIPPLFLLPFKVSLASTLRQSLIGGRR